MIKMQVIINHVSNVLVYRKNKYIIIQKMTKIVLLELKLITGYKTDWVKNEYVRSSASKWWVALNIFYLMLNRLFIKTILYS